MKSSELPTVSPFRHPAQLVGLVKASDRFVATWSLLLTEQDQPGRLPQAFHPAQPATLGSEHYPVQTAEHPLLLPNSRAELGRRALSLAALAISQQGRLTNRPFLRAQHEVLGYLWPYQQTRAQERSAPGAEAAAVHEGQLEHLVRYGHAVRGLVAAAPATVRFGQAHQFLTGLAVAGQYPEDELRYLAQDNREVLIGQRNELAVRQALETLLAGIPGVRVGAARSVDDERQGRDLWVAGDDGEEYVSIDVKTSPVVANRKDRRDQTAASHVVFCPDIPPLAWGDRLRPTEYQARWVAHQLAEVLKGRGCLPRSLRQRIGA